jgi:hypothetical protein
MDKQVYKVPSGITREQLIKLVGVHGSVMNPILDKNGNLIISMEEWSAAEFLHYKQPTERTKQSEMFFSQKLQEFTLIPYEPVPRIPPKEELEREIKTEDPIKPKGK